MLAYWADVSPADRTADAEAAIFQPSIDFRTFELQFHTLEVKVLFGFLTRRQRTGSTEEPVAA